MVRKFPQQEQQFGHYLHYFPWVIASFFNIPRFFEFKSSPTILVETERNGSILSLEHYMSSLKALDLNISKTDELMQGVPDRLSRNSNDYLPLRT